MNRGKFIVFEGIDGCGKTTQTAFLAERLESDGYKTVISKEPTDSPVGKLIRKVMTGEVVIDSRAVAPLFAADRTDHIAAPETGLLAILDSGVTVIADRYCYSSYAYQSIDSGMDYVIAVNKTATELLKPDIVIFIDVPPEVSLERIASSRERTEIYETKERLIKVRENYFAAFEIMKGKDNICIIDGSRSPEEIAAEIYEAVRKL